jgi:hypothetical protein
MNPRFASAAAFATLALLAAGCGGEDEQETFAKDYRPISSDIERTGQNVAEAVNSAEGKTDAALATQFGGLARQADGLERRLGELDPPEDLKSTTDDLTAAMDRAGKDLRDIAGAARDHDAKRARTATEALARDSAPLRRTRLKLEKETAED